MNNQRVILFRGFHPCEDGGTTIYVEGKAFKGRWIYGGYVPSEKLDKSGLEHLIIETAADGGTFDVLLSTICQYTGLTDKNGAKIFEGDKILAKDINYKAIVEWQSDTCRFLAIITNRRDPQSPHFFYVDKGKDRDCQMSSNEVIGTIWDEERQDERD